MQGGSTGNRAKILAAAAVASLAVTFAAGCARDGDAADAPGGATAPAGAASNAASSRPGERAGPDASAPVDAPRAAAIRAAAAGWPRVEGRWTRGAAASSYVAYFDGDSLRYLEETLESGNADGRLRRYWFEGGALAYYEGAAQSSAGPADGAPPELVPVVVEFRGPELVRAVAREHAGEKKLAAAAIDGIRRDAAALAGAAIDEWNARVR